MRVWSGMEESSPAELGAWREAVRSLGHGVSGHKAHVLCSAASRW